MEKTERVRPRSRRARWSAALAVLVAAPGLAAVVPAAPALADNADEHYPAVVIREWEVVPPQASNCIYNGTPFGGPDAYYDNTLTPTCGSYQYTDFINPEGQRYRRLYQHVTGWDYTWYGDADPPPPTNVPKDKVKNPEPPMTVGTKPSKPEEFSGSIIGNWRVKPTNVGQWYGNTVMTVGKSGYGALTDRDKDPCDWKAGNPTYRNLKGHGPTWTGERFRGPCVPWDQAWAPVTVTVSPDGNTLTENVTGYPTPMTWLRTDVGLNCGDQGSLAWNSLSRIYREAITSLASDLQDAFFADTCSAMNVNVTSGDIVLTDEEPDTTVAAKAAGKAAGATCKKATFPVKLQAQLNAYKSVDLASYNMATRFCYDGTKVWKPAKKGFAPEAAIEDVKITGFGLAYQVTFLGSTVGNSGFMTDSQKMAETTITSQWNGGLPILKWAWPENDNVTATLRVGSQGTAVLRMGS